MLMLLMKTYLERVLSSSNRHWRLSALSLLRQAVRQIEEQDDPPA